MPLIRDEWIERIKAEVSLVLLAERLGMTLKKTGQELMGRCPFPPHEDSTPSLSINEEKNFFRCFGCGAAGTSIDWTMREKGLKFRPAVELLLEEFFPELWAQLRASPERPSRRFRAEPLSCPLDPEASDTELTDQVVTYYQECGKEAPEFRAFLEKRAIWDGDLVSR
ncbi:MAG: CHC2 zinc finger domain-containing protein, partial [Thermoanaerobaculia bacterium]